MPRVFIPIVVLGLVAAFSVYRANTTHFECPNCGYAFKVTGLVFAFTFHFGLNRLVTCPRCHTAAMLPPIPDGGPR